MRALRGAISYVLRGGSRVRMRSLALQRPWRLSTASSLLMGAAAATSMVVLARSAHAQGSQEVPNKAKKALPSYTAEEVAKHRTLETGVWVTYKGGVYDISSWVPQHPGGMEKIMLAAGASIEPFWAMYQNHNTEEVRAILEEYRIGNLQGYSAESEAADVDPYANDPVNERHPALRVLSAKPFNGESPLAVLTGSFVTPNELFYIRNHLPVPQIDLNSYRLVIEGEGVRSVSFTLDQLKSMFPKHSVVAAMQCAGNRRHEMIQHKDVKGLDWQVGAMGNAEWSGVSLRDVLRYAGFDEKASSAVAHIQFEGLDRDMSGTSYGASITVDRAMNPSNEVLLAFEMNGRPLSRDHGFPLRVVVPGIVGARHVKWLGKISPSRNESNSHWQRKDYKSFSPNVDWSNVDWSSAPAIQDMPVQSAICDPAPNSTLPSDTDQLTVKGYAWSGGGRGIVRVDVSADGGQTWQTASLTPTNQPQDRSWAWTPWTIALDLPAELPADGKLQLVCKATDSAYNSQPDAVGPVWNLRGVVNNAWHRVPVTVAQKV